MCKTWQDHRWKAPRFVYSGRHQTMGRFNRFVVRCEHCPKETTMTEWLDLQTQAFTKAEREETNA